MSTRAAASGSGSESHGKRIFAIWAVATVVLMVLMIWVIGPHIPPLNLSNESHEIHFVNVVLSVAAVPVLMFVWVYLGYAIVNFRQRGAALEDGPPMRSNTAIQILWLSISGALVIALGTFGTWDLFYTNGAGGGQGPTPLFKPADAKKALQIQVIGQQWMWTYRFPSYGGVETPQLDLPVNRLIEFHVTSLDVIHDFWAIELGVKADAVPGADNIAYVKPEHLGAFQVRCDELCGLWHAHMNMVGHVVSGATFSSWINGQVSKYAGVSKYLPKYRLVYYPQPLRNGG
jgi:cytochrome c oxidase subunit II